MAISRQKTARNGEKLATELSALKSNAEGVAIHSQMPQKVKTHMCPCENRWGTGKWQVGGGDPLWVAILIRKLS